MDEEKDSKGELIAFMDDIKKESQAMMNELKTIDNILISLKSGIEAGAEDKKALIKDIDSIRTRIGVLEQEDRREMNEEEIAESLLKKLKKWVDKVI